MRRGIDMKIWRKFGGHKYRLWVLGPEKKKTDSWVEYFKKEKVGYRTIVYGKRGYGRAVYVVKKFADALFKKKVF